MRLEQRLKAQANNNALPAIPRRPERDSYPLSFSQQRLWFLQQWDPQSCSYNDTFALRLQGPLDVAALRQALDAVVARHEALRTRFVAHDGHPVQVIAPAAPVPLPVEVLPANSAAEIARWARQESQCPFDLSQGLLLRTRLLQATPHDHTLLLTLHHIASDGWSLRLLLQELSTLYGAFASGRPSPLSRLPVQYADFALWQHGWLEGEVLARQLAYWRVQLGGELPALALPGDKPRPAVRTQAGRRHGLSLPAELTDALKRLAQREGVTLYMVLLAAFQTLLHRYSGQDDILVGSPVANRTRVETEGMLGVFINTLVLRTNLAGNPEFGELLGRVRAIALGAFAHQEIPFEKLVEELHADRDPSRTPIFQALFVLQDPRPRLEWPQLQATLSEVDTGTAKFDLTLALEEMEGQLRGFLEYSTDLFEAETIARWAGHWQILLAGIAENANRPVSELPLLGEAERRQMLVEWNQTAAPVPEGCVPDLFAAQAARRPDAVAVVCDEQTLTYGELERDSNRLAHYLRQRGVGPDVLVGLCLERTPALVTALLGIMKAGGAYVPFDPTYPKERLAFMLEDTRIGVLVTEQALAGSLPESAAQRILIDAEGAAIAQQPTGPPRSVGLTPGHLAYVMYTSGSTGTPKGVMIEHRGIIRLVFGTNYIEFNERGVFVHHSPISFDASTLELWGPLLHGGCCVLLPDRIPTPRLLRRAIQRNGVNTVWLTSALFNTIVDEAPETLAGVKRVLTGGEALSVPHVRRALRVLPGTAVINGYGPTESTTFATTFRVPERISASARSIPIGRPIGNTRIYLLDQWHAPVPIGVAGELWIAGDGLARGYLNAPDLTARKFLDVRLSQDKPERLYRTGDLARFLPDGSIEFLGRIDAQVKLNGFRIELGEIETVLKRHASLKQAAVLVCEDRHGAKFLIAYVVPHRARPTAADLRTFLQKSVPEYMVPQHFILLEQLPLTANGKLNRGALPAPVQIDRETGIEMPETDTEKRVAVILENLLNRRPIGVNQNFFALGGTSLLAVRLLSRIERSFQRSLPLTILFQAPTVKDLARVLESGPGTISRSTMVPVQAQGHHPPLFSVYSDPKYVFRYNRLSAHLGPEYPVYGVQPRCADRNRVYTIEEIAAFSIQQITAIQPQGPYFLTGFCFGGLVAFEIARQFRQRGEEIGLLALIDSASPTYMRALESSRPLSFRRRLLHHCGRLRRMNARERWDTTKKSVGNLGVKIRRYFWQKAYLLSCIADVRMPRIFFSSGEAFVRAGLDYRGGYYDGGMVVIRAATPPPEGYFDLDLGWRDLAGGVSTYETPGEHFTLLEDPNVSTLADTVKALYSFSRFPARDGSCGISAGALSG